MKRLLVLALLMAGSGFVPATPIAQSETVVFQDFFSAPAPTAGVTGCYEELSRHRPDLGARWLVDENTSGDPNQLWKATDFRKWVSPCGAQNGKRVSYLADSGVPLTPDYYSEFELADPADNAQGSFHGAKFRRTSATTFYGFGMRPVCYPFIPGAPAPNNSSNCSKFVADGYLWLSQNNVVTILDTCNCDWRGVIGASNNDVIQFGGIGNYIFVKRNGVVVMDATNGAITAAGLPGLLGGSYLDSGDKADTGMAYDRYRVVDMHGVMPPPPPPPPLTPEVVLEGVCGAGTMSVVLSGPTSNIPSGAQAGCRVTVTIR
ncbi:MAG: hypothetical protein HOP16_16355 [Acidobacteria bacterium]|nr:hypothetical protein [Acidobacteriota bacterium]